MSKHDIDSFAAANDETRFFRAFASVAGESYLLSKSLAKPISSSDVFLSDHFQDYGFNPAIEDLFKAILNRLLSNFSFSGNSLSHHIDGMLVNHPQFGSRMVEFDEEQHFTPALRDALHIQSQSIDLAFNHTYQSILTDIGYLNNKVLKKHRIKQRFSPYPTFKEDFVVSLQKENVSGYIRAIENGFPYIGGRIAQRAYYDCLRNAAHLSPRNKGLQPILRFPKTYFEQKSGLPFNSLSNNQLAEFIKSFMSSVGV
jgi:hypothetical protein